MIKKINRILISADDNIDYIQFLPIFSMACQKIIGVKPTLAYIGNKSYNEWKWMETYCQDILHFKHDNNVLTNRGMAFVARMLMRYKFGDDVCMIGDIDLIPLNFEYFTSISEMIQEDKFLSAGYNVFQFGDGDPHSTIHDPKLRKFPSCYTIATSKVWKEIVNPMNLDDKDVIMTWKGLSVYDHKESVDKDNFCDESLMRALIQKWNPTRDRVIGIDRKMINGKILDRIDRSSWRIDKNKLYKKEYVDAHCPRPLIMYNDIKILTDYIEIPFVIGGT